VITLYFLDCCNEFVHGEDFGFSYIFIFAHMVIKTCFCFLYPDFIEETDEKKIMLLPTFSQLLK